jgi:hypothetical protein
MSQFETELVEFYANRSKYQYIKPDLSNQDWTVYVYGRQKQYARTLSGAVRLRDAGKGE